MQICITARDNPGGDLKWLVGPGAASDFGVGLEGFDVVEDEVFGVLEGVVDAPA